MKHFVIEITNKIPFEEMHDAIIEHRAYLKTCYDKGFLLMSGPQSPRIGGIIIARAESIDDIQDFINHDPYHILNVADHRCTEFVPVLHNAIVEGWLGDVEKVIV